MAGKNIILCSDGTGNKGGYTPDTNVFKLYNMIDLHDQNTRQVKFYDNGVGTSSFNPLRFITSAFGTGFKDNVLDLYCYLAKSYEEGDSVFIFGFSRGAATARAFNGLVSHCGVINGRNMDPDELISKAREIFTHYENNTDARVSFGTEGGVSKPMIEMIGVWDTVSALGAPKRTEAFGPVMAVIKILLKFLDILINAILPNSFYNYAITPNIRNAYQALSIDDERTSFWPEVWDEKAPEAAQTQIEQVWFMGMHSDVGGGYSRGTLANIPLEWMMLRAQHHGVAFKRGMLEKVQSDTNIEGVMHNSRSGLGVLYRYHPRQIRILCDDITRDPVKLHESVVKRLGLSPADYRPTSLPEKFAIVSSPLKNDSKVVCPGREEQWLINRQHIENSIRRRKILYNWMLSVLIGIVIVCGYFWITGVVEKTRHGFFGHLADIFVYFLPNYFNNAIELGISQFPIYGVVVIAALVSMFVLAGKFRTETRRFTRLQKQVLLDHLSS